MNEDYNEDYSEGWKAFYRQEPQRRMPMIAPDIPLAYERYQRDKRFNEGWKEAQSDYQSRTGKE